MICISAFVVFKNNHTMQYVMLGLGMVGTIAQFIVLGRRKRSKQVVFAESPVPEKSEEE
jgi:Flp pilus assembly protein protease CpaA